jgi:hypothetical protein
MKLILPEATEPRELPRRMAIAVKRIEPRVDRALVGLQNRVAV